MSIFNGERLSKEVFRIDSKRMRTGWYSDAYFSNIALMLDTLSKEDYAFKGESSIEGVDFSNVKIGELEVEMQIFTRRQPFSIVGGIDEALAILSECTGHFDEEGNFINTFNDLEVEAVHDGTFVHYDGDSKNVEPVLKIRGKYSEFAELETPVLGVLSETTRIATNVYDVLLAAKGKDVLFFPARFAHYKLQALHGYAYSLAVQAYNAVNKKSSSAFVSTDDQGKWWGGKGGGTVAHSFICSFLGDPAETMLQFSRIMPINVPRIALVDFHNDCIGDSFKVMKKMFEKYLENYKLYKAGKISYDEVKKYILNGIRTDTSSNMRDLSIAPIGDEKLDLGVNPRLVWKMRNAIDMAYKLWDLKTPEEIEIAQKWCKDVNIVVTGGFNAEKIRRFEKLNVPVDIYGVGSSLLENCEIHGTNNDYTADIVRVKINGQWVELAKNGRKPCDNPNLIKIQ